MRRWLASTLFLSLLAPAGAAHSETHAPPGESRPLELDDYFRLKWLDDPRISPAGDWVAYTLEETDLEENESHTRVWMAATHGGDPIPMTAEGESSSSPRWSPDGQYVSFLSARGEAKAQVWTLNRQGGEAIARTEVEQGVEAYEWSPDSRRLVLVIRDPKDDDSDASADDDSDDDDSDSESDDSDASSDDDEPEPWVVTRRQFKVDYVGYLDSRRTHLHLFDLATAELTQITTGDYDDSSPAWSSDGTRIAFTSNRTEDPDANYNTDVWVVAIDGEPDTPPELTRITANAGPDGAPAWSPSGGRLTFTANTDLDAIVYSTQHLASASATGGDERVLTAELDRWIYQPRFSPDGRHIYFLLEAGGEQSLARMPAGGGAIERLISGERIVDAFDLHPSGTTAALVTSPHRPPYLAIQRAGEPEIVVDPNKELLAEWDLGGVEKIAYDSPDGTPIEGFVVKPPEFEAGTGYPTVLWIHGGPVAQYDYRFDFQAQLFAANGYLVVRPNPRGSSGYGQAFSMAIWRAWGETDYEDVMAGVDHVIERGWADPERLGVGGWSYGGMLTNHVITRTDRFKGAITGASATLYVVNYGHDQYQRWWEYELGLPWRPENREIWEDLSPFNRVENIVTPTLIVCGEKDWNVPVINSEQLFMALKRLGRTTELIVYPGEFHGISTPTFVRDRWQRYLDWFGRYVASPAEARPNAADASAPTR